MSDKVIPVRAVNKYKKAYTVYIGRGSDFGNDYTHLSLHKTKAKYKVASVKESIDCFERDLLANPKLMLKVRALHNTGATLGCFCKPEPCHGDVIAKYANMSVEEFRRVKKNMKRMAIKKGLKIAPFGDSKKSPSEDSFGDSTT